MNNLFTGARYFIDGFSMLTKPGIKRFVIIPVLINVVFFIALFFVLKHYAHALNAWIAHFLPTWLQWLGILFWLLFFITFVLFFIYMFITIANLIAAPFNSFLAEKVELYLTGHVPEQKSLFATIKDTPRILGRQFAIIGFYLPRALICLVLFFVPVIHLFAGVIWFLFSAWFLCLTYIDYPSDNHQVSLAKVRELLKSEKWTTLGFGVAVLFATMIPIINFFAIPAAVAGATKFWIEEYQNRKLS